MTPDGNPLLVRAGVDNSPATKAVEQVVRLKIWESLLKSAGNGWDNTLKTAEKISE